MEVEVSWALIDITRSGLSQYSSNVSTLELELSDFLISYNLVLYLTILTYAQLYNIQLYIYIFYLTLFALSTMHSKAILVDVFMNIDILTYSFRYSRV